MPHVDTLLTAAAMASEPSSGSSSEDLFFASHNPSRQTTVLLIHGLFSNHLEWDHVALHLTDYHLIIPDLPQHSQSRHIGPISLGLAADKVSTLITKHAKGGRAHVVGLSLGGFVTQELIRRHPELVISGFVSGSSPLRGWQLWAAQRPALLHYSLRMTFILLGNLGLYRVFNWSNGLLMSSEMMREMGANETWELCQTAYSDLKEWQGEAVKEVGLQDVRILAVAGGKGDIVEGVKDMGGAFRSLGRGYGKRSCTFVVKEAVHAWNLQFPHLFAKGVLAWIKEENLPNKFECLD